MKAKQGIQKQVLGTLFATVATLAAGSAYADRSGATSLVGAIRLGEPTMAGTGCPRGSVFAAWNESDGDIELVFEKFQAEAGGRRGKSLDRKACAVALPVQVPSGYSVSMQDQRLSGFAVLPSGGKGTLNVESFFAGTRGPVLSKTLRGPLAEGFAVSTEDLPDVWSACGQDVIVRMNMSVTAKTNGDRDQAVVGIVSAEDTRGLGYFTSLKIRRCD